MGQGTVVVASSAVAGKRWGDGVPGWVVRPESLGDGPSQDRTDALPYASCCLWAGVPDRHEAGHHVRGGDFVDRCTPETGIRVGGERRPPLLSDLPPGFHPAACIAMTFCGLLEGGYAAASRVQALFNRSTVLECLFPGFG